MGFLSRAVVVVLATAVAFLAAGTSLFGGPTDPPPAIPAPAGERHAPTAAVATVVRARAESSDAPAEARVAEARPPAQPLRPPRPAGTSTPAAAGQQERTSEATDESDVSPPPRDAGAMYDPLPRRVGRIRKAFVPQGWGGPASTGTSPTEEEVASFFASQDVDASYANRSFVPGNAARERPRAKQLNGERVHILAFNNKFHAPGSKGMNGTCNMMQSAAVMGYTSLILFGVGTKLRSRETGSVLRATMIRALELVPSPDDFVLFVDLHDTVFTLPAIDLLDRYFAAPLDAPPFIVQGDVTMFASPAEARLYDQHYGEQHVKHGIPKGTFFPYPNGGLFFARKRHLRVGVDHFFGHGHAHKGIDMGWIALKSVTGGPVSWGDLEPPNATTTMTGDGGAAAAPKGPLQQGFLVLDSAGALSQNVNAGGSTSNDALEPRELFPRNGRVFERTPKCTKRRDVQRTTKDDERRGRIKYKFNCDTSNSSVAPAWWRAPIWHFPGPIKPQMALTLSHLKVPVAGGGDALRRAMDGLSLVQVHFKGRLEATEVAQACHGYTAPFFDLEAAATADGDGAS